MNFEEYKEEQRMLITELADNKIVKEGISTVWIADILIDYIALEFDNAKTRQEVLKISEYYKEASPARILANLNEWLIQLL